jgi:nicotinate phosphoribosyltransferase
VQGASSPIEVKWRTHRAPIISAMDQLAHPSPMDQPAHRPRWSGEPLGSALLTDLYQLSMLQAYHHHGMHGTASFELFFRRLPPGRSFLVCAGLETVLDRIESFAFEADELAWLESTGRFERKFLEALAELRFTGDVTAAPEGSLVFADEPVLRVTAPIMQAQILESRVMNLIHYQTLVASKAARCTLAAGNAQLIEFGLRRAHGAEAALLAARAAFIAGFSASSNALAGRLFGIPITGTMAHSFVQAHEAEALAFEHFAQANPDHVVLLIDTYDITQGAHRAVAVGQLLARQGISLHGVRIDSGDLAPESLKVRAILDEAGFRSTQILASGNLDEWRIASLRAVGAPIDLYCVGTALTTSSDQAALDCAYKLVEYAGRPTVKRSPGKATLPGCKQVWRSYLASGLIEADEISLIGEKPRRPARLRTEALLRPMMQHGRRLRAPEPLATIRGRCLAQLAALPPALRQLEGMTSLPVRLSQVLDEVARGSRRTRGPSKRPAAPLTTLAEDPAHTR